MKQSDNIRVSQIIDWKKKSLAFSCLYFFEGNTSLYLKKISEKTRLGSLIGKEPIDSKTNFEKRRKNLFHISATDKLRGFFKANNDSFLCNQSEVLVIEQNSQISYIELIEVLNPFVDWLP